MWCSTEIAIPTLRFVYRRDYDLSIFEAIIKVWFPMAMLPTLRQYLDQLILSAPKRIASADLK